MSDDLMGTSRKNNSGTDVPLPGEVYLDSMRGCLQIEGSTNDFLQVLTKQIKDCTV